MEVGLDTNEGCSAKGKRRRHRHRGKYNIKLNLKEIR
jgi:hypothetical protein